ncbi:MAG: universal stress protein [Thermodesulfobacteriota bacterium]
MTIVYATDGSPAAREAGGVLAGLPLTPDDRITLLAVASRRDAPAVGEVLAAAREDLAGTRAHVEPMVREGYPDEEILAACGEIGASLLAVGATGTSGLVRFGWGSVAARVTRHAPCSVLVARRGHRPIRQVILGYDGAPSSRTAATQLLRFPLPAHPEVLLTIVLPVLDSEAPRREPVWVSPGVDEGSALRELGELKEAFLASGRGAETAILRGYPAARLLEQAEEVRADLVVVGAHGQSLADRFHRFLLGSVSEQVARHAPCSVLVMRED